MKNKLIINGLVLGIIILFLGASVLPSISGYIWRPNISANEICILNNDLLDQSQDIYEGGYALASTQWLAQSFKPSLGTLTRIELLISREPQTSYSVKISIRVNLLGNDIVSVTKQPEDFPIYPQIQWTEIVFPDTDVVPEGTYYIVCTTNNPPYAYNWFGTGNNLYERGNAYFSYDQGSSWANSPTIDLCFKTYGKEYQPVPVLEIKDVKGGFGKISAILNNIGGEDATNVDWKISVKGGILGFINVETTGNITLIPASLIGSETVQTDKIIFGLGKVDITINATYAHSWVGTAFVLGPFVLAINQTQFTVPEVKFEQIVKAGVETWKAKVTIRGNDYAQAVRCIQWTNMTGVVFLDQAYDYTSLPGCDAKGEWASEWFELDQKPCDCYIEYRTKLNGKLTDINDCYSNPTNRFRTEKFGPPLPEGWQPLPPTQ